MTVRVARRVVVSFAWLVLLVGPLAGGIGAHAATFSELAPAQVFSVDVVPAVPPVPLLPPSPQASPPHESVYVAGINHNAMAAAPFSGALAPWHLGERNWHYGGDSGLGITLGRAEVESFVLGSTAVLGGVQLSQSSLADHNGARRLSLSLAAGALNYAPGSDSGDLAYGPAAAATAMRYDLGTQFSLHSEIQAAPDLLTTVFGAQYDAHNWGQLQFGMAHGNQAGNAGWRYQTGYKVKLADALHVSVQSERDAPGYADLTRYRDGGANVGSVRNQWMATLPTQRWGDLSGTYETVQPSGGTSLHRFGFSQQFWYSPNLRIGLQAQRESRSGDYDIGLRFSVPIY